jgi:hypothetical protein
MTREKIIQNLKYEMERHKNDRVDTFSTNISLMCKDILDYLENDIAKDYISRQEVREFVNFVQTIKDNHNEKGSPINYGTICDIVIKAHRLLDSPPVTPVQEWIPVSEKLPEEDGEYLLFGKIDEDEENYIFIGEYDSCGEQFGIWQEQFDRTTLGCLGSEFFEYSSVIAWQPLPPSYQGE